ncbi:Uncharacterized protein TCM_008450 [Theobroma cacao]|uniref:Retroviral polymerase SH3-like domain-containing protein n=1 Tax=Theobroma cacao TaxID=3641 RepID=A0A061EBR5_THECC|nr:Uncharacterized protein TCM_008450 [Theobroma cacao]
MSTNKISFIGKMLKNMYVIFLEDLDVNSEHLGKFDAKSDEAIFLGYALNSKAYRAFNKRTLTVEESVHVVFDESNALQKEVHDDDDDIEILEKQMEEMSLENNKNNEESSSRRENETPFLKNLQRAKNQHDDLPRSWRFVRDHPQDQIIDDIVYGATNEVLCKNFAKEMQGEFEMSMMGEFKYFLGLQIKQSENESSSIKKDILMICSRNLIC